MRPRTKSIQWIVVLALFLSLVVFAETGRAETKQAGAKAQEKRLKAEVNAKVKAEAEKKKKETAGRENIKAEAKAELAAVEAKKKSDLANADKRAKRQAKARAEDKKTIEKDYKAAVAMAETAYQAANKRVKKRAKSAGVDGLGALFADKKKASILKSINEEKTKIKAEYESAEVNAKTERDRSVAALELKTKTDANKLAQEKKNIAKDYDSEKAEIDLKLNAKKIAAEAKAKEASEAKAQVLAQAKAEVAAKKQAKAEEAKKAKADAVAKKKAEQRQVKETKAAREKAKAEKEAAIAQTQKTKKLRLTHLEAKTKADSKALAEECTNAEKEYKEAKTKVEAQYKDKGAVKKAKADAEVEAKAELAEAKDAMKSDLATADKKAKAQTKAVSEDKSRIESDRKVALADADSEYKEARKKLAKRRKDAGVDGLGGLFADKKKASILKSIAKEEAKAEAEHKGAKSRIVAEYKQEMKNLESRSKAQVKESTREKTRIANEYRRKEAQITSDLKYKESSAKAEAVAKKKAEVDEKKRAKAERKNSKAQAKTDLTKAEKKMKSDLAEVDKESKRQVEAQAYEKKRIEKDYKKALARAESEYKAANKRVERKAKDAGVDGLGGLFADKKKASILKSINKDKAKIKAEYESAKASAKANRDQSIVALDSKAKSQAKESANEKTRVAGSYNAAKSKIDLKLKAAGPKAAKSTAKGKPAWKTEYEQALAKVEADYRKNKSDLQEKKKLLADDNTTEKAQIEADYEEAIAKANLKFKYEDTKAQFAGTSITEDVSPKFIVKEIKISGNTLISTADLLANMPAVYATSNPNGNPGEKEMYDFRVLHEIIIEPGQEREVSRNTVQGFTRYILSKYHEKKYAGIYVYVSAKAVKGEAELVDGVLPIEILEGKVAEVTVDRYDFDRQETEKGILKDSVLKSWSPAKEGQTIKKKELDDFVRLLNLNPDRYISAIISRGDKPDTLNLGYDVYEANPWHWYAQLDNSGTDKRQWNPRVGVTNTNLTGRDDRFSFMYQAPPDDVEKNYSVFGNYEFPFLTPRLRLGVYAGYSQFEITPETGGNINFRGNGSFYGGTLRYNVLQMNDWFFDFLGSLSHETSKVTPSLGIAADVEMNLFGLGGEIHRSSDMSSTSFSFNQIQSMGGSSKEDFTKARLDTDPDFTIDVFSATHKQFLDKSKIHELSGSFRSMTSNKRLIPAKMTTFGGLYSVRGYSEDGIVADGGILASLQYRFDLTKYMGKDALGDKKEQPSYKKKKLWPPNVSLLTFIDYGRAKIKDPVPGEEEVQKLLGAGLGTAVELGDNVYGAVYYSWPMRSTDDTDKGDGRWNFNFIYRW